METCVVHRGWHILKADFFVPTRKFGSDNSLKTWTPLWHGKTVIGIVIKGNCLGAYNNINGIARKIDRNIKCQARFDPCRSG